MSISIALHMDCKNHMRGCAKNTYDIISADAPYFTGPETRGFYSKNSKIGVKAIEYPIVDKWELPDQEWFDLAKYVSRDQIIWGANYYDFIGQVHKTPRRHELEEWLKDHPVGWIVWDKCNGNISFNDFELAWTSFDRPTVIYKFLWNGFQQGKSIFNGHLLQGNKRLNQKRIHPTEKPIPLYKWKYHQYTKPGYKILDTHLGSGSSRIAALEMEIDFVGCEKELLHFNNQEKRFNKIYEKVTTQKKIEWL